MDLSHSVPRRMLKTTKYINSRRGLRSVWLVKFILEAADHTFCANKEEKNKPEASKGESCKSFEVNPAAMLSDGSAEQESSKWSSGKLLFQTALILTN